MTTEDKAEKSRKLRKTIIAVVAGGVAGFFGAMGMMMLIETGLLGELGTSREIALLVALIYVITGLAVGFGVVNPKVGSKFLNVEDAEELREQRTMLGYSTVGIVALGTSLAIAALAAPLGPIPPLVVAISVVGLFGLCWFTTSRQLQHMDELMRAVSTESGSASFYLLLLIGGGWSLLAHLEFVTGPQPLDWLTMIAAVLLLGTFIVCGKRGMLTMR